MKRPLLKLPKWLQLTLVLAALLFLALSYWQFRNCPRLSAAGELRRMERDYQYEQTRLKALLSQGDGSYLAIGLSDDRLHMTLLQKKGLWWLGESDSRNGLLSFPIEEEPLLTVLPWTLREGGEYYWAALAYVPGTQAASGALTLTIEDEGIRQGVFPGRLCWQQDGLYLFLLEARDGLTLSHAVEAGDSSFLHHVLEMYLCRYLLGDPNPPYYAIMLEGTLYDQGGATLNELYKAYPIGK